jgi:tRNA(fMet)-specific endonuclease VapC
MNRYLIDTNILLYYIGNDSRRIQFMDENFNLLSAMSTSIISVVTEGELKSIALQRNWGQPKLRILDALLQKFLIADIHVAKIVEAYAEIDAFSQGKLLSKPLGMSSRSMGKNDLWIAATASVLGVPLLTTDKDFTHLDGQYLDLAFVDLNVI